MVGRALDLRFVIAIGAGAIAVACSGSRAGDPALGVDGRGARAREEGGSGAKEASGARYFHVLPEEAFWVAHEEALDRVMTGGARLELSPDGEVLASAWEPDEATSGQSGGALRGALALPPRLGGGFLHWSQDRVFWSKEFTGPLESVTLPRGSAPILGIRSGLGHAIVITDAGPLVIAPGDRRASALSEPAIADLAAVDEKRALSLDVFGRAATTIDAGKTWRNEGEGAGVLARAITVGPKDLWLDTWLGRVPIGPDGARGEPAPASRAVDVSKAFQLVFQGTRGSPRDDLRWALRDTSPLQSAVFAGVTLPDGSAIAAAHGGVARVDLATGRASPVVTEWIPQGLSCEPLRVDDALLFVCVWDPYQGFGGYVLRSVAGEPPVVEKAFTDDGYYVADDHGAVGYVGSCQAKPRLQDPNEVTRDDGDIQPKPVICLRRGPGDWAELRVEVEPETTLLGWIPGKDGTAAAMILRTAPDRLPEPVGSRARWSRRGDVRVLFVYQELAGFRWSRPSWKPYAYGRSAPSMFIDKRFHLLPAPGGGAAVEGWVTQGESFDLHDRAKAGVSIGTDGVPTVHPLPPLPSAVSGTGDFGVTITLDGGIYETRDHGRTWRFAGPSPVAPSILPGICSAIGCALPAVTRVGWGAGRVATTVVEERPRAPEASWPALPKLVCEPVGAPTDLPGGAMRPSEKRESRSQSVQTSYGEAVDVVQNLEPDEDSSAGPGGAPADADPQDAPPLAASKPGSKGAPLPAPKSTHTIVFRIPFEPDEPVKRLPAVGVSLGYRRALAVPLLGPSGDVSLLLHADKSELLLTPSEVIELPVFEGRRPWGHEGSRSAGLRIGRDRALVLGDARRRTSLELHGPKPTEPPMFVGLEREMLRNRVISVVRRGDGALGILVLDGAAPETAGVAVLDREGASIGPVLKLAPWSTLTPASDARCKADKEAWSALVVLNPLTWLALDRRALPGVTLGTQGLARVRWGRERVCVDALDVSVSDDRRRDDPAESSLVISWSGSAPRAAMRWQAAKQSLRCSLDPAAREGTR